ncbi:MAG: hypothetical protein ACE5R4_01705 [Armatimonadota bacterium]
MQPARRTDIEDSLEVCPECAYEGGFHVLLERRADLADANLCLYLKCPSCRTTYDVGWLGRLTG